MKIHPISTTRTTTFNYTIQPPCRTHKKLLRLPHVFAKVLELPFHSDADVSIEEADEYFRFTVSDTDVGPDVVTDTVVIHPGVTKIVVRSRDVRDVSMTEFAIDVWRFRLPNSTRPELSYAVYDDGDLTVFVPKDEDGVRDGGDVVEFNSRRVSEKLHILAASNCVTSILLFTEHKQLSDHGGDGPIKFGDVFEMSGQMAEQPISPRDAAAMESAENRAFGKTIKGGPASIMRKAAAKNVESGLVDDDTTATAFGDDGILADSDPWKESQPSHDQLESAMSVEGMAEESASGITIGEALEAAARAIGDKPVDRADAAAIQAAEMIATGTGVGLGSGLGAEAQAAASLNAQMIYDEDKTKLAEIIEGATNMLTDDKTVTKEDAERVKAAELKCDPEGVIGTDIHSHRAVKLSTTPGGVAEAVSAAARINQQHT